MDEYEKQKQSDEKIGVIEADENLLQTLLTICEPIGARRALIATKNKSFDDAVANYFEQNDKDPNFNVEVVVPETKIKKVKKPRYIPLELQRLFTRIYGSLLVPIL
jgi:hypothetical protein